MKDSLTGGRACLVAILLTMRAPAPGLLARELGPAGTRPVAAGTRVLHFPQDQSLGVLSIEDRIRRSEYFQHNYDPSLPWAMDARLLDLDTAWETLGVAQGDVTVPADRDIALRILLKARPSELVHPNLRDRCFADPEDLAGLSGLEPNDLGTLSVSSLAERTYADERVIKPLSRLTGLKMLRLDRTGVTDKGMEYLRSLRSLRSLQLTEPRVGDAGLAVLKNLRALEYMDLCTATGDAGLKYLGQLPNLRWLRIRMGHLGGPGLAELANLPRLERLSLWGNGPGLSDQHIRYLEGLTHLKSLTLWGAACEQLTDASLASIGTLQDLEELYFVRTGPRFTSAGIAHLKGLRSLKKVDFSQVKIDEAGMRHLAAMPSLVTIHGGLPVTADSVKTLTSFQNLKSLDFTLPDRAAPGTVRSLFALTSLEELRCTGSTVGVWLSDDSLVGLESLGRLKRLHLWGDKVTDRSMAPIGRLKELESVGLWADVSKRGLNQLSGLTHLRTLDVLPASDRAGGMDEVPLKLSALTELRTLSLRGLTLRDGDVASLAGLRHLEWLALEGAFTEGALWYLEDLPDLKLLNITGVSCATGEGLAQLGGLRTLGDLTLSGRITDAALARLPALPSLWSLRIVTDEPIRAETIARLRKTLPVIEYIHIDKLTPGNLPLIQSSPPPRERAPVNPSRVNRPTPRPPQRRR
jgi:Leucine-rich repeat (LRR) protein